MPADIRPDFRMTRLLRISAAVALGCLAGAGLTGCGDEASRQHESGQATPGDAAPHKAKWLELSSPLSPAQWLASRGEAAPKPISDPNVQHVSELLTTAHTRYGESERMIANRSAQLSDMLGPLGIDEGATDILEDLTSIGGAMGRTEGFGAISQYYFNLRAANVARADALATLKARYGPKAADANGVHATP